MAKDTKKIITFTGNPDRMADDLLQAGYIFEHGTDRLMDDAWTLAWWRDDFYEWQKGCWSRVSDAEMKRQVTEHLQRLNETPTAVEEQTVIRISTNTVNNILLCLSAKIRIPENRELNTWPNAREKRYYTLPVENGLLMRKLDGKGPVSLEPHTPKYFTLTKLPYNYDPDAKCPKWLEFLDEVMLGRQDYTTLLKQWCGYLFRPDLREQKFLLCVGEGANGKGVMFSVIEALVGEPNCSHVSLGQFGQPFAVYATLGKVLNATNESSHIIEHEAENTLKTLVAGDRTGFERKFKEPIQAKPTAKMMIATNALPRFNDKTQGVWRRILLVPFDKTIEEDSQIRDLAKRLKTELPGILNWALEGLFDLNTAGGFSIPVESKELLEEYRRDTDPARAFLLETYVSTNNGDTVSCSTVYENYKTFCTDNNNRPLSNRVFGRCVKRIFPNVKKTRPGSEFERAWRYEGITSYQSSDLIGRDEPQETATSEQEQDTIPF